MRRSGLAFAAVTALSCGGASTRERPAAAEPAGPSIVVTEAMGPTHVGAPAPDFELPDETGAPVRLSGLRGSVVVVAFVTSWCPFSRAEQPYLAGAARAYAGRDVRFLAVSLDETDEGYRTFVSREPMGFPVLHAPRGDAVAAFRPTNPPVRFSERNRWKILVSSTLVVDREGTIRFFTLTDTVHFDAQLRFAREAVDRELAGAE